MSHWEFANTNFSRISNSLDDDGKNNSDSSFCVLVLKLSLWINPRVSFFLTNSSHGQNTNTRQIFSIRATTLHRMQGREFIYFFSVKFCTKKSLKTSQFHVLIALVERKLQPNLINFTVNVSIPQNYSKFLTFSLLFFS